MSHLCFILVLGLYQYTHYGLALVLRPPTSLTMTVTVGSSSHPIIRDGVNDKTGGLIDRAKYGLSTEFANSQLIEYGQNVLNPPVSKTLWELFLEQFDDRLVQVLLAVVLLSGTLAAFENDNQAFVEPLVIMAILMINAAVGVWQSKSAEDSIDALKKLQPDFSCVLRDGEWNNNFPSSNLVPGDIIALKVGNKIPADSRIISLKTTTFNTDEGSLTGESATVSKTVEELIHNTDSNSITSRTNMVFSGTLVTNGICMAEVISTGMRTEIGKINTGVQEAQMSETKTPLAQKLDEFGQQLTYIIGGICAFVWIASIPKFDSPSFNSQLDGAIYYAKTAVALGVAAIPEGLPAVITLCLSLGTRRMAKRNVIVRKLSAVETLGCTS
eukprot:gene10609-22148_t